MPDDRRLDQVVLTLDGSPLRPELYGLVSLVRVEESVHLPDTFMVRFDDPHFTLFDQMTFTIGSKLDIAFSAEGELTTVTRGEITAISVEQGIGGVHELVLQGMDVTHRLAKGVKTRSFQQMTDSDIVTQVVGPYGFTVDVDPTPVVHDYVLQSSQTDYAFLRQRAGRIGFDVWVADGRFYFKPAPKAGSPPPVLRWGGNLHKFKVRFSAAERCDEVTVRGWDPVAKQALVGRATTGDQGTTAPAATALAGAARKAFGNVVRFAGHHPVTTQREADELAGSLLLKASGEEVIARGEATGDPLIAAGALVTVEAMGEKLSGQYRVTSVEHVYGAGAPYVTRFLCGGKEPGTLLDLIGPSGNGHAATNGGAWGSLVIGVVTNNVDDQGLGRVKVKYPTLSDSDESTWARLVAPGAGPDRGIACLPEVNDEVLVGFEHGDLRRPLVFGGLWNQNDPPPPVKLQAGRVMDRSWTSRNGHTLRLSDGDGEGRVTISLGDGSSNLQVQRSKTSLEGEQSVEVRGRDVEVKATGRLVLKAASVEIAADAEVKVTGSLIRLN